MQKTIIVSNRLPVSIKRNDGALTSEPSQGGLATALGNLFNANKSIWIGWPGIFPDSSEKKVVTATLNESRIHPVYFDETLFDAYYGEYSNKVLWPLFHYLVDRLPITPCGFDAYRMVNELFAEEVLKTYKKGDTIWIHDYHLLLLPAMIREEIPDAKIGFFLHIPFPSSEIFRILPQSRELLAGVCGADLVGFHTHEYARHFVSTVKRILHYSESNYNFNSGHRQFRCGVYPISIDYDFFENGHIDTDCDKQVGAIRSALPDLNILLSVDRLDYTKGVIRRLYAFEELLKTHPELRRKVVLIQVAVKTRLSIDEFQLFKSQVDECIGRINGEFGDIDYQPVHYIAHGFSQEELIGIYKQADIMLVTPLRDGMNLVAKEFIAAGREDAVLVLSQFAGAACELKDAVVVNPYDIKGTSKAIFRAISMNPVERQTRMKALKCCVKSWQSGDWEKSFLHDLQETPLSSDVVHESVRTSAFSLTGSLQNIPQLLLLLDYDGTLVPIREEPALAVPDQNLLKLLDQLTKTAGLEVHIVSGRKKDDLEAWFASYQLELHAEHGLWTRTKNDPFWSCNSTVPDELLNAALDIACSYEKSTPGAMVEKKSAGFAWHYRQCDSVTGIEKSTMLMNEVLQLLPENTMKVIQGKKVLEFVPYGTSKGNVVKQLKAQRPESVIVAMGDDVTDVEMFDNLTRRDMSVQVGRINNDADYFLPDVEAVREFLRRIIESRSQLLTQLGGYQEHVYSKT